MNDNGDPGTRVHDVLPGTTLATGWFVAAAITGALVLVLLGLVVAGCSTLALPGLACVLLLVWLAQRQFTETHRRHHHRWRGGWDMFWTGSPERHAQAQAWRGRDPVRWVEASRWVGIGLLGLALVAGIVFVGASTAPH
jgi:hypothetical protein